MFLIHIFSLELSFFLTVRCGQSRRCVHDAGWMTSCLGYLGVTVNDRMELEELFHYDILVSCPPRFNITFSLPNWSSRPDRTFDVIFDDAHTSYRVFITTITFQRDDAVTCAPDTHNDDVIRAGLAVRGRSVLVLVSVIVISSTLVLGTCSYVSVNKSNHTRRCRAPPVDEQAVALTDSRERHLADYDRRRRRTIVVVRVLLQVVFALSCTFTACSTAFYVSQWPRLDDVRQLSVDKRRFDAAAAEAVNQLTEHVTSHSAAEMARVTEMQLACDGYVGELGTAVAERVALTARSTDIAGEPAVHMYRRATRWVADEVERLLADIRQSLGVQLRPAAAGFRRAVRQSLNSPWLSYAQNLFNKSVERSTQTSKLPSTSNDDVSFLLPPEISTFAEFLGTCNVEEVQSWRRRFLER